MQSFSQEVRSRMKAAIGLNAPRNDSAQHKGWAREKSRMEIELAE
jgi:hypothetical protein